MLAIQGLLNEGKTYAEIGEAWGFSRSTIDGAVRRLRGAGLEVITRRGRKAVKLT